MKYYTQINFKSNIKNLIIKLNLCSKLDIFTSQLFPKFKLILLTDVKEKNNTIISHYKERKIFSKIQKKYRMILVF